MTLWLGLVHLQVVIRGSFSPWLTMVGFCASCCMLDFRISMSAAPGMARHRSKQDTLVSGSGLSVGAWECKLSSWEWLL